MMTDPFANAATDSRRSFLHKSLAWTGALCSGWGIQEIAAASEQTSKRGTKLIVRQNSPLNAEPPLGELVEQWITPTPQFYIRNHGPTPRIAAETFRLKIEGLVRKPLSLSLKELSGRFPAADAVATMTCAGNRRYEHSRTKKVGGVQWREGAIGNARWQGVRLSDVLKAAGLKPEAKHAWFDGLDEIDHKGKTIVFGGSIPIEKALADTKAMPGTLLCTQMNGKPLTPEHGAPLRTVVPGYIGARSVKWLGRITVSDRPSPNHYVAEAYKIVTEGDKLELAEAGPIYTTPLNSVICAPQAGAKLKTGTVRVTGYALPPGRPGRTIARVELSTDNGRTFKPARIASARREYCWVLWSADVPVSPKTKQLVVRCVDSAGHPQPRTVPWNMKGYMYNAWHHVPLSVRGD
jgi:sulfite oxidase